MISIPAVVVDFSSFLRFYSSCCPWHLPQLSLQWMWVRPDSTVISILCLTKGLHFVIWPEIRSRCVTKTLGYRLLYPDLSPIPNYPSPHALLPNTLWSTLLFSTLIDPLKVYHLNHRPTMTMETTPTLLQDTRVIDNDAYNYFTYHLNHGRWVSFLLLVILLYPSFVFSSLPLRTSLPL